MAQEITEDMTGKFTPGPWGVFHLANDPDTYGKIAGKPIITTGDADIEICAVIDREEDAKLIAIAPEMFHLLAEASGFMEELLLYGFNLGRKTLENWTEKYNKLMERKC